MHNAMVFNKIYSVLPERGIRLLTIHPGSSSDRIKCDIQIATLTDLPPSYCALSHVWGSDLEKESILLNGEEYYVRKNMAETLCCLRRAEQHVTFWVDTLCINQDDEDEKDVQIPLMGKIYENAERVVAFLGQHQDSSDTIFKILQRLDQGQDVLNILLELGFGEDFNMNDALNKLLTREYWSRAWIVQEIVLGRRDRRIQCGTDQVSFSALRTLRDSLLCGMTTLSERSNNHLVSPIKWHPRFQQLQEMGSTLSANDYLDSFLDSRCSSPRDHIYAFYNLYSEEIRNNIEVNVKKDPIEIVCQAAKSIIKETESLRIMTFRGRQSRPVDLWQYKLPTWCPFFGVEYLSDSISPKSWKGPIQSRKDDEIAIFSEDGKLMEVRGSIMGHISRMVFRNLPALRPFENIDFDDERNERRIKTEWYFARECMYLFMSVLADQNDYDELHNISQYVPGGETLLAVIQGEVEESQLQKCEGLGVEDEEHRKFSKFRSNLKSDVEKKHHLSEFAEYMHSRELCTFLYADSNLHQQHRTEALAVVPQYACANDMICAIHGCEPLMVLRKKDDFYTVVGEANIIGKRGHDLAYGNKPTVPFILK